MADGPFANGNDPTIIEILTETTIGKKAPEDRWQNNDSANKYYEAQKRADMYAKLKERQPMVFEYMQTSGKWTSISMYINPDRLSITNQKVKGKAYTRGGIFYHHWGDDHSIMSLSGTTGLSGMKGIEVLEEIYYASGTLLKYQEFGHDTYGSRSGQSNKVNLNSPSAVAEEALNMATANQVDALLKVIVANQEREEAWEAYKKSVKLLEDFNSKEAERLAAENRAIKERYSKLSWLYTTNNTSNLNNEKKKYAKIWTDYLADKKKYNIDTKLTAIEKKHLKNKIIDINEQYGLESSVDNSYASSEAKQNKSLADITVFITNSTKYGNLKITTGEGLTSEVSKYRTKVVLFQRIYGFPEGTFAQLSKMKLPLNDKETDNFKSMSALALKLFKSVNEYQSFLAKVDLIEAELEKYVTNSKKKPSSAEYKAMSLKYFSQKLPNIDDDLKATIVAQQVLYYEYGGDYVMGTFGVVSGEPAIPHSEDVIGYSIISMKDRIAALNTYLTEMAKLEASEMKFKDQLKANAFNNIMDELKDTWKPRQIVIYYENRAYIGHFDAFSYARDAANPLLIRYDMRLTLTKQIIGTVKKK